MADQEKIKDPSSEAVLEGGAYDIIRGRLNAQGKELRDRLGKLNDARKSVFGAIEHKLIGSDRVTTDNNCVPRDMVPVGNSFIFGYNVQVGLRAEIFVHDVFAVYQFTDHKFSRLDLRLLEDARFQEDFANLYRYYKQTVFYKFARIGPYLFMAFRIGKSLTDLKTFKWLLKDNKLVYVDNRSDAEFRFPNQHDFVWKRTRRDYHRFGEYPHISIEDRVFVETVGGDLTIKIEDNTRDGSGIYSEPVDNPDQTLDDAEIFYTIVGHLILLRIKPYQEKSNRYLVFNEKLQSVVRIDAMEDTCVFLPDDHGIIFPTGYYLQNGEYKLFDLALKDMLFDGRVAAPNGEDYLYIFYQREMGHYVLLSYNLIEQKVATPIVCDGYSLFENGELVYFRAEESPQKHHTAQFWQTPYVGPDYKMDASSDSPLYKIGNKDIVRAMAECHEVLVLVDRENVYASLYIDLVKRTGDIADSWFWLGQSETFDLRGVLLQIKETAGAAIDEFEKVQRLKKANFEQVQAVSSKTDELMNHIRRARFEAVDEFVHFLADLRVVSGEIVSAGELRYVDRELITRLESRVREQRDKLSRDCVTFLLQPNALAPYQNRIDEQSQAVATVAKVADAKKVGEDLDKGGSELELLIEIVSNLEIDDPTKTTEIIDNISTIYSRLNQIRAELKNRRKELARNEGIAEFSAQLKLLNQALVNYLDVCDVPEKCEAYLTKLMVQVEELEGRFADFDEFVLQLTEKRDEIYNAFEARRLSLVESRNKKASSLMTAADRILQGIRNRVAKFTTVNEINGYFAGDLMIEKVRDIVKQLTALEDSVKADSIQSRLKTIREDTVRQLQDRQDLYEGDTIKLGNHRFSVNTQKLGLTLVAREADQFYHLSGTDFFEKITDPEFEATRPVWDMEFLSENKQVYRAEYLAWSFLREHQAAKTLDRVAALADEDLAIQVQQFMGPRFQEGYAKGVHDHDATIFLRALLKLNRTIGLLVWPSEARACASVFWAGFCSTAEKELLVRTCSGLGAIHELFPNPARSAVFVDRLRIQIRDFVVGYGLFSETWVNDAAEYLFLELLSGPDFCISPEAATLFDGFQAHLRDHRFEERFKQSLAQLKDEPSSRFFLLRDWMTAFTSSHHQELIDYRDEAAALLFCGNFARSRVINTRVSLELEGLRGDHAVVQKGQYQLHYNHFSQKLESFHNEVVPVYLNYQNLKKTLAERFRRDLKLDQFKPRILSSFVRNQLIDQVYLPIIGDNLAKQMGVVGEKKRTDLMGLLLLISPPGYGKTTLMEYVADRLGLIFMKINGPAIGHQVTSIDPGEAPNLTARQELEKLNLAFEMGDNVMIYVDDIQHCNPEFLQKFISLCDGQRKIEGVYKGVTRTYDMRGKKVAVVMAGNPYTESGDKFQIPDMLANRADTYNLGDIIGDTEAAFRLSYLENCLTSNPVLNNLMARGKKDVYSLVKIAETGSREGIELEGNYSAEEINESINVLKKLLRVRDVILKVNLQYIESAAQADAYRTEPGFKLQGSYRNMNKIAEKVLAVMNDQELETLLLSHYENESQTLTSGAEANMLKFKELTGRLSPTEQERWDSIKTTFQKNSSLDAAGGDRMGQAILQLAGLGQGLESLKEVIGQAAERNNQAKHFEKLFEGLGSKNNNQDTILVIKELGEQLKSALSTPRALDEESLQPIRKLVAQTLKALTRQSKASDMGALPSPVVQSESPDDLKQMFGQVLEGLTLKTRGGIDEETMMALKATLKMSKNSGREERQAMLILLEKQFHLMEQWLKPIQESTQNQDQRLLAIQVALERSLSTHEWVMNRLNDLNEVIESERPAVRRKPPG